MDYLELYFPYSLKISNSNYPKYRIVDYGDTKAYENFGLEFYNKDPLKFADNVGVDPIKNIYYFSIQRELTTS